MARKKEGKRRKGIIKRKREPWSKQPPRSYARDADTVITMLKARMRERGKGLGKGVAGVLELRVWVCSGRFRSGWA